MKIIGLTGGIGSGKTTVAYMFKDLNVPVYIADLEAKNLTNSSKRIKQKLINLLSEDAYVREELNRKYVADLIFNDESLLKKVNNIIHPEVAQHFEEWIQKQEGPYCIKEAAILFENGGYKKCDLTILIIAPVEERINRVINRDKTTKIAVKERIKNQWSDEKKKKLADFVIENIDLNKTQEKVKKIHLFLSKS